MKWETCSMTRATGPVGSPYRVAVTPVSMVAAEHRSQLLLDRQGLPKSIINQTWPDGDHVSLGSL